VVGSINVDLTFRTPRLPEPGETLAGRAFHLGMGGKGANQAVAAARLGAQVSLVARIGNDAFGQQALRCYQTEGIDTSFVVADGARPTGVASIMVDDKAENSILIVAGANASMTPEDVQAASSAIQSADAVLCQLETPLETTLTAFRLARSAGVRTILTPAPAATVTTELLQLCDLCVPNEIELQLLTGRHIDSLADAKSAAAELRGRGISIVVVTMGRRGAMVLHDGETIHVPAIVVEAVDPTGAGDAFTAALAVYLGSGSSLHEAAKRANVVAALTVTRLGAQTAFPSLKELEDWSVARQ
jgi:ribokinase